MNYKVGMISLGCTKNQVDAEMLLYTLKERGFQFVSDPEEADAVIVNTCGFIESAKQESIDEILELGNLKREGKIKAIVVTGCLAERYQDEITKQLYEIDAAVGIGANDKIADVVLKALAGDKVELFPDKLELPLSGGRVQSTPPYTAYLKVAEGCDNCCTYCAIPLIRGRFRSRTMENVLEEARELAAKGVKELNVIAQDTTRYGEDLYGTPQLAKLLKELCKIDGFRWIRVLYCYPDRVTDELIDVMASEDKIVKYIDLPLQHCNGEILRRMNRRGNRDTLTTLLQKIKEKMPDVVLRSTFITGFPGETEEQFEELAEFANDIRFQRLGCFAYSQEEDTPAALMPDSCPTRSTTISSRNALTSSWTISRPLWRNTAKACSVPISRCCARALTASRNASTAEATPTRPRWMAVCSSPAAKRSQRQATLCGYISTTTSAATP